MVRPLTTSVDNPPAGSFGVVNGTLGAGATFTAFDKITGNEKTTFNLVDSTAGAFSAASIPSGSQTTGLETVNLSRAAVAGGAIGVVITNTTFGSGIKNLSIIEAGAGDQGGAATITLNSAKNVSVVSIGADKFVAATITDTSTAAAQRGSSLNTVTVQGVDTGAVALHGNAISTVNLNDVAQLTTVNAAAGARALTVNASGGVNLGGLTDAQATSATLNISGAQTFGTLTVAKATNVAVNATAVATATVTAAVATEVSLGGSKSLAATLNAAKATDVIIKGAGGVTIDVSAITTLTKVDTTGSTAVAETTANGLVGTTNNVLTVGTGTAVIGGAGNDFITVGATKQSINLGGGTNQATVSVTALGTGGSINGGSGTKDVLVLSNANAATITGTAATAAAFKAAV